MRQGLGKRDSTRLRPSVPDLATAAIVVAAAVYLIWLSSHLWFLLDDFAFLMQREVTFVGHESLLRPHNDHWVTLPILLYRLMFQVVGLHFLPFGLVTIGLHLASCVLFAVLLRRLHADPWVVALMTAVLAFLGPGGLDILWAFQMGFLGPVAIAFACLLLVDRGDRLPAYPVVVWTLLVAAVMFSGAGVTAVAWVAAYTWLRRGFVRAVVVGSVPTLVYVAWYLAYGRGASPAGPAPLDRILPFVVRGLTSLWDAMVPLPWLGLFVLVVVTAVTLLRRQRPELRSFALAGLMTLAFHYVLLAISRAGWGVDTAASTRYLYVGLVLTLPAVAFTLQAMWDVLAPYVLPRALFLVALSVVLFGFGAHELYRVAGMLEQEEAGLRERIVAAAELVDQGAPLLNTRADPEAAPDIDTASLARPYVRARLPELDPSAQAVLDAAGYLQVDVSEDELDLPSAREVTYRRMAPLSEHGPCHTFRARAAAVVELRPDAPGEIRLRVSQGTIATRLVRDRRQSRRWDHEVEPGVDQHVGSTASDATLRVMLPSGEVTVCTTGRLTRGR